jgi:hypothetical protein
MNGRLSRDLEVCPSRAGDLKTLSDRFKWVAAGFVSSGVLAGVVPK